MDRPHHDHLGHPLRRAWPSSQGEYGASTSSACLLGFAEAGFFPGIIFYLTLWFPAAYRARIIGYFMAAIPLSSVLGAPVSGALLTMEGSPGCMAGSGCSSSRRSRR